MPEDEQPIQDQYQQMMNDLARGIDEIFNGKPVKGEKFVRKTGFTLLVFPFEEQIDEESRINYISNANRENMVEAMTKFLVSIDGKKIQ